MQSTQRSYPVCLIEINKDIMQAQFQKRSWKRTSKAIVFCNYHSFVLRIRFRNWIWNWAAGATHISNKFLKYLVSRKFQLVFIALFERYFNWLKFCILSFFITISEICHNHGKVVVEKGAFETMDFVSLYYFTLWFYIFFYLFFLYKTTLSVWLNLFCYKT